MSGVETPDDGPMVILLRLSPDVVVRARTTAIEEVLEAAEPEDEEDEDEEI